MPDRVRSVIRALRELGRTAGVADDPAQAALAGVGSTSPADAAAVSRAMAEQRRLGRRFRGVAHGSKGMAAALFVAATVSGPLLSFIGYTVGATLLGTGFRAGARAGGKRAAAADDVVATRRLVESVWTTAGLAAPRVFVADRLQADAFSVRLLRARGTVSASARLAHLPDDQARAILGNTLSHYRHRDSLTATGLRSVKLGIRAYRKYLVWLPVWVAGGGVWGVRILPMIHAGAAVMTGPLYLSLLVGGAVAVVASRAVLHHFEYRSDRDAVRGPDSAQYRVSLARAVEHNVQLLSERIAQVSTIVSHLTDSSARWLRRVATVERHTVQFVAQTSEQSRVEWLAGAVAFPKPASASRIRRLGVAAATVASARAVDGPRDLSGQPLRQVHLASPTDAAARAAGALGAGRRQLSMAPSRSESARIPRRCDRGHGVG